MAWLLNMEGRGCPKRGEGGEIPGTSWVEDGEKPNFLHDSLRREGRQQEPHFVQGWYEFPPLPSIYLFPEVHFRLHCPVTSPAPLSPPGPDPQADRYLLS